jgi:hypothetical protein
MTAPIYFDEEKNSHKNSCDISCTFKMFCDILGLYPMGYRGGTHDSNGRRTFNRRGGGSLTENAPGLCQEALARWKDCGGEGNWTRRALARQTVHDREPNREANRNQLNSRKLNSLAFSVASQLEAYRLKPERATNCDVALPCVHFLILRLACLASPVRIDEIWQEVAGRNMPHE